MKGEPTPKRREHRPKDWPVVRSQAGTSPSTTHSRRKRQAKP